MITDIIFKNYKSLFFFLLLLCFEGLNAQLKFYTLKAPEVIVPNMKKIALVCYEGNTNLDEDINKRDDSSFDYGGVLRDELTSDLLEEFKGVEPDDKYNNYIGLKTNIYTIVERHKIEEIFKELRLSLSGAINDDEATKVGNLLGVDYLLLCNLSIRSVIEKSISYGSTKDKEGVVIQTTTYQKWRQTDGIATIRVVSVNTGKIVSVISKSYTTEKVHRIISKEKRKNLGLGKTKVHQKSRRYPPDSKIESKHSAKMKAIDYLSHQLVNSLLPQYEQTNLKFEKSTHNEYQSEVKKGKKALKRGDISTVYSLLEGVMANDESDPAIAYNLGLVYEAVGRYNDALKYYKYGSRLNYSKKYLKAEDRCNQALKDFDKLRSIGVIVPQYDFEISKSKRNSKKVIIRGTSSLNIYEEPNEGSNVISKVIGGNEYKVLEYKGPWVKILIPGIEGDKEGYIQTSNVKKK